MSAFDSRQSDFDDIKGATKSAEEYEEQLMKEVKLGFAERKHLKKRQLKKE